MILTAAQHKSLKECLTSDNLYSQVLTILGLNTPESGGPKKESNSNGQLVLVVDDEPTVSSFIQIVLEHQGFQAKVAHNGADCLTALKEERKPDLIIIDIGLPDMDGGELCQKVRLTPNGKDVPVVFISGLLLQFEADELNENKKDNTYYVGKPFTAYKLIESVSRLLPQSK